MRVPAVRENARACRKLKSPIGQTYASCQHLVHTTTLNCPLSEAGTLIVVEGDGARKALQKCTFDVDCPFAYAKARFNRSVSNRSVSCPQPKVTLATEKPEPRKSAKIPWSSEQCYTQMQIPHGPVTPGNLGHMQPRHGGCKTPRGLRCTGARPACNARGDA